MFIRDAEGGNYLGQVGGQGRREGGREDSREGRAGGREGGQEGRAGGREGGQEGGHYLGQVNSSCSNQGMIEDLMSRHMLSSLLVASQRQPVLYSTSLFP